MRKNKIDASSLKHYVTLYLAKYSKKQGHTICYKCGTFIYKCLNSAFLRTWGWYNTFSLCAQQHKAKGT